MRTIFALLALLISCEAQAQSFPGFMPPQSVVCNNTTSDAPPANCQFIDLPLTPSSWFQNDTPPVKIQRLGDRVFIGDAVKYTSNFPANYSSGDWYSQWACSGFSFCTAYVQSTALLVETSVSNKFGTNAITGIAGTIPCFGANCGAIPLMGIGVNNVAASAGKTYNVWGIYAECNNQSNNTGQCSGIEIDLYQYWNYGHSTAYDPYDESKNTGLMVFCGGASPIGSSADCGSAIYVEGAGTSGKWVSGLVFQNNSIKDSAGPSLNGGPTTVAIAMPSTYAMTWYSSAGVVTAGIYGGTANKLNLSANSDINLNAGGGSANININAGASGGIIINNQPGVSCSGPPSGSFTVTNGIVTHC